MYIEESLNIILEKVNSLENKLDELNNENKKLKTKLKQNRKNTIAPKFMFIDSENVQISGFVGIETLTKNDTIYLFKGKNLSDKIFKYLFNTTAKINFIEIDCRLKNALDLELVSSFANLLSHKKKGEFYIISNDAGFDIALKSLKMKKQSKEVVIGRASNILLEGKKLFFVEKVKECKLEELFISAPKEVEKTSIVTPLEYKNVSECLERKINELTEMKNLEKIEIVFKSKTYSDFKTKLKETNINNYKSNSVKLRNLYISYKISNTSDELIEYEKLLSKIGLSIPMNLDAECLESILHIFLISKTNEEYLKSLNTRFKKNYRVIYNNTKNIFEKNLKLS